MKRKQLKKELIILAFSLGLVILSLLYTLLPIDCSFIDTQLQYSDQLDLLFNLFTIQATIATLSISIIAIITGFQSKSVCGVSVTHYVTSLKPCLFIHKILMIADLVITVINYFLVAFELYNVSISIFIISVIISCILIIDTSFVFKNSSVIYKEIRDFLLENYTIDYLHDLELSIYKNISLEHTSELEYELGFINQLLETELKKPVYSKENISVLESIIVNCFLNAYLSNNKEMVLSILKEIDGFYVVANSVKCDEKQGPYPVDVWSSIYLQYFTFLSTISLFQLQNYRKFDYLIFKQHMYENLVFEKDKNEFKQKNNYYLEYYYPLVYWRVIVDNPKKGNNYNVVKERIIHHAYLDALWSKESDSNKLIVNIKGLCYLLKAFIENGEISLLKTEYLKRNKYCLRKTRFAYVFLVTVIYSYYLSHCEPIVEGTAEQLNAKEYLMTIVKDYIKSAIYEIDIVSVLRDEIISIHSLIDNWEKFENGVAKAVALEPTITEVLFFLSISKYYDEQKLSECFRLISSNNVDNLIMTYFSPDSVFDDRYKSFQKRMFNQISTVQDERFLEIKSLVRGALSRECKNELIKKAKDNPITDEMLTKTKQKYLSVFEQESKKYCMFIHEDSAEKERQSFSTKISILDIYDFSVETSNDYIHRIITQTLYRHFIHILKPYLTFENISFHSNQKQDHLINLASGMDPDTFVGNRETFWEEDDKDKLSRFTKDMYKIDNPYDHGTLYLLNSQWIHFQFSNVQFEIVDCSLDDFDELNIETKDGQYYYSRYSNIMKVPFEKDELFNYLQKTRKVLKLSFDIEYSVKRKNVGCGIKIQYD